MTSSIRGLALINVLCVVSVLATGCSESHVSDEDSGPGIDGGSVRADAGPPSDRDAAPPTFVDAGPPSEIDAGSPPVEGDGGPVEAIDAGPPGVTCGTETCVEPEICCVESGGGTTSRVCQEPASCMGVAAACDGPEDCATGEACCGMRGTGGAMATTSCVADAMCTFGRICHVDADCTGGDTCCAFMGGTICSPFCPGGTP